MSAAPPGTVIAQVDLDEKASCRDKTIDVQRGTLCKGAAVAFRPRDRALADKFNRALEQVYADGTFETLMKRYFDYDIAVKSED